MARGRPRSNCFDHTYQTNGSVTTLDINYKDATYQCLIDTEDLPKLISLNIRWRIYICKGKVHSVLGSTYPSTTSLLLHRFVLNPPNDKLVDHKNSNVLDNRKDNLRVASCKLNCQNISRPCTNTSGCLNVHWRTDRARWVVQIDGKRYGSFVNKEDAIVRAVEMRAKLLPFSKEAMED